jgi:hypothetical protein
MDLLGCLLDPDRTCLKFFDLRIAGGQAHDMKKLDRRIAIKGLCQTFDIGLQMVYFMASNG